MFKLKAKHIWPPANFLGSTLVELMIVLAIMGILSLTFYINTRVDNRKLVVRYTEDLLVNLRQMRNMAVNRTTHQFSGESTAIFPPGGYGMVFDSQTVPARYFIYADKSEYEPGYQTGYGDEIVGSIVNLPTPNPNPFEIVNNIDDDEFFYFQIVNEKKVFTDMAPDSDSNRFIIRLRWPGPGGTQNGYEGVMRIGERASDGSIITNFGHVFNDYIPPPSPPPPDRDPWDL